MNKYEIAANITLASIDGTYQTLSAAQQKEIFGGYVFGKMLLHADTTGQGTITASKNAGHGNICKDTLFGMWSFEEVAQAANAGQKLTVS